MNKNEIQCLLSLIPLSEGIQIIKSFHIRHICSLLVCVDTVVSTNKIGLKKTYNIFVKCFCLKPS